MKRSLYLTLPALAVGLFSTAIGEAGLILQTDDFSGDEGNGWGAPAQSITFEADGGPAGAGDAYLSYTSFGSGQGNSRMVIPNETPWSMRWAGDYLAEGLSGITLDVLNSGATPLALRLAIADDSTWFTSTEPVRIDPGSSWASVAFAISDVAMSRIGSGSGDFATVAQNVTRVRLLSSEALPPVSFGGTGGAQGDRIAASIGIDNVAGIPEPATVTQGLLAVGLILGSRKRRG